MNRGPQGNDKGAITVSGLITGTGTGTRLGLDSRVFCGTEHCAHRSDDTKRARRPSDASVDPTDARVLPVRLAGISGQPVG
jgi:hypothetical protein